jgi:hypothetical protein
MAVSPEKKRVSMLVGTALPGGAYQVTTTVGRRAAVGGGSAPPDLGGRPSHCVPNHITGHAVDDPSQKISLVVPSASVGVGLLGNTLNVYGTGYYITGFHGEDITIPPAG